MTFSICKQFIKIGDDLFLVKRTIREEPNFDVDFFKSWFEVDTVFRKDGLLFFANKIENLEYEQVTTA